MLRLFTEEEVSHHWTHAAVWANGPYLEQFVIGEEGAKDFFSIHRVGCDDTIALCHEFPSLCGLKTLFSIGCICVNGFRGSWRRGIRRVVNSEVCTADGEGGWGKRGVTEVVFWGVFDVKWT